MTEEQLISKLHELKQIKPRSNWVVLTKANILDHKTSVMTKNVTIPAFNLSVSNILGLFYYKKFAYALATLMFILVGMAGVLNYRNILIEEQLKNSVLSEQAKQMVRTNVEDFKRKSQDLALIIENNRQDSVGSSLAVQAVKDSARNLTNTIKKDPKLAQEVASEFSNSRTYLNVAGNNDLKETSNDLYKTIDEQLIADLKEATLNHDQQKSLEEIIYLYDKNEYASALESILMLNMTLNAPENTAKDE